MDIGRSLKTVVATGKVQFGLEQAKRAVAEGKAKMLVVSSNCPQKDWPQVGVLRFQGTNAELGASCGKPFPISVLAIIEPGESDIMTLKGR